MIKFKILLISFCFLFVALNSQAEILTEKVNVINSVSKITTEFTINKSTGKCFRLVHNKEIAFIIEGTDKNETSSVHKIEEFSTEQECLDRIKELGLKYSPPDIDIELVPVSEIDTKTTIEIKSIK